LKIAKQQFNAQINEEAFQPEADKQLQLL